MAEADSDRREVNARIVYWGAEGAGKATNLRAIHRKLRPDHRGRLEAVATQLDPSVCSYRLPIELGEIAGVKTRIQIIAVPGGPEQAPTRKQLLDRVDGIVFVVDARRDRIDDNVAAIGTTTRVNVPQPVHTRQRFHPAAGCQHAAACFEHTSKTSQQTVYVNIHHVRV